MTVAAMPPYRSPMRLRAPDPRVCLVKFRRNYGQTPAMAAGIAQASGEVIVTMDGDLQNDPPTSAHCCARSMKGYDIVVGWRFDRQDKLVSRKIPSRIANALIAKVTGVPIKDNGCSLKAYRASLIKKIPLYSEMHRFIPAMASIAGPKIAEIKVQHHARQFGQSKYGLSRIYKVLLDLMVIKTVASFTARPMLWFGMLSIPMLLAAAIAFACTMVQFASEGTFSLPIAGCGVIFLSSAIILMGSGATRRARLQARRHARARVLRTHDTTDPGPLLHHSVSPSMTTANCGPLSCPCRSSCRWAIVMRPTSPRCTRSTRRG
jgi:hypothetical protein